MLLIYAASDLHGSFRACINQRVESNRVESGEPVPATSRAVFTPRVRRLGTCAQVHALTLCEDPAACARALTRAFVRVRVRAAYVDGLRFDSGGYRIGRRYYP